MICKECGREMPDTDKFCGKCGTPNPLFENLDLPVYTQPDSEPVQEHQPCTQPDSILVQEQQPDSEPEQEYRSYTQPTDSPAQEHQPYTQPDAEPVQEHQSVSEPEQAYRSYTQPAGSPAQEYRPYGQPISEPTDMKMARGKAKVKYTCSLTAVIVCIVVIFLLSVACGIFAGLYLGSRPAALAPAHSVTQYESGGDS